MSSVMSRYPPIALWRSPTRATTPSRPSAIRLSSQKTRPGTAWPDATAAAAATASAKPVHVIARGVTCHATSTRLAGVASLANRERKGSSNMCAHDASGCD